MTWALVAMPWTPDVCAQRQSAPTGTRGVTHANAAVPLDVEFAPAAEAAARLAPNYTVRIRNTGDKVVVSYGLQLFGRASDARLRLARSLVVRPRDDLAPRQLHPLALPLAGEPPEYELRPTFVLFADGTWAGDATEARHEIASLREEYAVARAMGEMLSGIGPHTSRDDITRLVEDFSRRLARATARGARLQLESALRTLGTALDERLRVGRTYQQAIDIVRDQVDRELGARARLVFVARPSHRG